MSTYFVTDSKKDRYFTSIKTSTTKETADSIATAGRNKVVPSSTQNVAIVAPKTGVIVKRYGIK